ncbi:MAG TPA: MFS transporter [Anaerolineaceae bacterium]|nr:MFS transporter [Chloroflexota bacterium]HNY83819.1 MFS transporter [Anaerolineaceae bacterium]
MEQEIKESEMLPKATGEAIQTKRKWRTLFALALGYFVDQGEGQAMSIFSPVLKTLWGLSYGNLSLITFIRSLLQSFSSPFWGFLSDRYSRKKVIIWGTGIWGIWTILVGFTQNFNQLLLIRVISGIGLGCLMPATFSIMADTFAPKIRGRMLGILESIGILGIIVFTLGLGNLATPQGWRWGFIILGAASVLSGLVILLFVDEPVRGGAEPEMKGQLTEAGASRYKAQFRDALTVLKIPTIQVAILQGLAGSMPWVIMGSFFILWLVEERGLSTSQAPLVFGAVVVGTAISNVIGGFLGDWAEQKSPKYGRTIVGQFSVISGIPFTWYLFTRTEDWSLFSIAILGFVTALFISWPGKGSKEPMMQGVVPPELRSTAFAMTTFIESGFAAIIALIFGSIADKLNLQTAMLWTIPFPWVICAILFSGFYLTYPKDSRKLRDLMAKRAVELGISNQAD